MSSSFEQLRKRVFRELQKEQARHQESARQDEAQRLGSFLQASLENLKYSRVDFAKTMRVEQEFSDALLDGLLPVSEMDDFLLQDMAAALDYEPNVLRILLGRSITPTLEADDDSAAAKRRL